MISKKLGIAALAAMVVLPVFATAPVHATTTAISPLPAIGSEEQKEVRERERVRRQQVRQNRQNGLFEPILAPLYKSYNSPGQQLKRAVD
ncbi:hypothetical protein [Ancylobacter defluvii]|uniref:Uncharacterized protein n=1 Tax=Ancylobacter defluvii TaxID=1282440 RepID=A0A9W6JSS5_9HYPH|nr:hypothetical protein [Ancylobacter defluvii]MBS7587251.1 hypothetical protein [Ancylobacter defluvii]GLK81936.1 hypothetical protein GCM10017653_00050 [Ancylobacter defluvii]